MKNTITNKLRNQGFTPKQIKYINNQLNAYTGMHFSNIACFTLECVANWGNVIRFVNTETGEIRELKMDAILAH